MNGDAMVAIDTESGQLQGTVTNDQIQKMPSYGRDVFQLLQLAPGSFGDGSRAGGGATSSLPGSEQSGTSATSGIFQTENAGQVSANGARTNQNNYQIDGVGVTSVSWGGTSVIIDRQRGDRPALWRGTTGARRAHHGIAGAFQLLIYGCAEIPEICGSRRAARTVSSGLKPTFCMALRAS